MSRPGWMHHGSIFLCLAVWLSSVGCDRQPIGSGLPEHVTCASCHGSDDNPAPPVDLDGNQDTAILTVGAHQAHVRGGPIGLAMNCSECHRMPADVDSPGHVDARPAEVVFGPLATADDAQPVWDRETGTCSNTYCHGASLRSGTVPKPAWTIVDGSQAACGACHGLPPEGCHDPDAADCSACHAEVIDKNRDWVDQSLHINGVPNASSYHPDDYSLPENHGADFNQAPAGCTNCHGEDLLGGRSQKSCDECHSGFQNNCTFCHGGTDNYSGAPPEDVAGHTSTTLASVGAHTAHRRGDSGWHASIPCSTCHQVPSAAMTAGHIDARPAELRFSGISAHDGLTPTFDPASTTCSNFYCHGGGMSGGSSSRPTWTGTGQGQAECGACHGLPPTEYHQPTDVGCNNCHTDVIDGNREFIDPSLHVNGLVDVTGFHRDGYAAPEEHGADFNLNPAGCTRCHGDDLLGGNVASSCESCHPNFKTNCTFCHGGLETSGGAPPGDVAGRTATDLQSVGAHSAHNQTGSDWHADLTCDTCHRVPQSALDAGHVDPRPAELDFGGIASTGGLTPAFDFSSDTCSNFYCHGGGMAGGTVSQPNWTSVGQGQADCGACHGMPPTDGHTADDSDCSACHGSVVRADFTFTAPGLHINGVVNMDNVHPDGFAQADQHGVAFNNNPHACTGCHGEDLLGGQTGNSCESCHPGFQTNCTFCHGGSDNDTGAPPADVAGLTATSLHSVGAHSAHNAASSTWHADMNSCALCHTVPQTALSVGHIDPRPAELNFGGLSVADGAQPVFNPTLETCSSSYCHGGTLAPGGSNTAPRWTQVDGSQASCGSCHALPPGGSHPDNDHCFACHGDVIAADGSWVNRSLHIDGKVDASGGHVAGYADPAVHGLDAKLQVSDCRACHGNDLAGGMSGRDCDGCHPSGWRTNCTFCHGGVDNATGAPPVDLRGSSATSSQTVGAHSAHTGSETHMAYSCNQCHRTVGDVLTAGHMFDATAGVAEVDLGSGLSPAGVYQSPGCTNLYCHGTGRVNGDVASHTTHISTCSACHPDGDSGSTAWTTMSGEHETHLAYGLSCRDCHETVIDNWGNIIAPALHVNGQKDVQYRGIAYDGGGCTVNCHGVSHSGFVWQ